MHVRFTTLLGMPVTDDRIEEDIASISGILINPDTAAVEGFFVRESSFLAGPDLFLASADIVHVGTRMRIRDADRLSPPEEVVRLGQMLDGGRTVMRQRMMTESGLILGTCADVQLETKTFRLEWLFPKKWWRWQSPVSAASIVIVKADVVVVKDPVIPLTVTPAEAVFQTLDPMAGTAATRVVQRASKQ